MAIKDIKQYPEQISGNVLDWYEGKDGLIVSIVKSDYPNEAEVRISSNKIGGISYRGDKHIILGMNKKQLIAKVNQLIKREGYK